MSMTGAELHTAKLKKVSVTALTTTTTRKITDFKQEFGSTVEQS